MSDRVNLERLSRDPAKVLASEGLSDDEKVSILESWKLDLIERQRASDENMRAGTDAATADVAERLRVVANALRTLRERHGRSNH
jgi:hypothetical protein